MNVFNVVYQQRIRIVLLVIQNYMIAQNEINVQGELVNKTDNPTVSYKPKTARILVQIK